jgi:hypothetical protein
MRISLRSVTESFLRILRIKRTKLSMRSCTRVARFERMKMLYSELDIAMTSNVKMMGRDIVIRANYQNLNKGKPFPENSSQIRWMSCKS